MFSGLRAGSVFYALDRKEPKIEIGETVFVSQPRPQIPTYNSGILSQPKNVVDVKVKFGSSEREYKQVPADLSIADFGTDGIVISDNVDLMINEVKSFKSVSEKALKETDKHKHIIDKCNDILFSIDTKTQKEVQRDKEFSLIKEDVETLKQGIGDIKNLLHSLTNKGGN